MHKAERRSSTSKRVRETEAQAVAFVVCSGIALETGSAAQDYIGLYGGDAKLFGESLEYVQWTATKILNAIEADESSAPPDNLSKLRPLTEVAFVRSKSLLALSTL